ncbi:MAG: TonB-dependent receptor, partial [Acidobacteriota bacterium]|nr:TonB-dependent receptor [Acidobacteriota bacterium]
SFSIKRFNANVWGQGTNEQTLTPTVEFGNYFATQDRHSRRLELFEVYSLAARKFLFARHEIKVGFDFNSVTSSLTYEARPVNILRGDGTLAERIVFRAPRLIEASNSEYVGFAQDRLLVRPNLSFDLGLRYEDQRIAQEMNLSPRFGFAWSPFEGDRTVFRGGIGLFYDKVPLNLRSFARYPSRTVTRYAADGVTEIDTTHYFNVLVDTAPVEPLDFRRRPANAGFVPENLRWNIQLDQIVTPWLNLRANVTASRTNHIYIVNPELDFRGRSGIVLRSAGEATYRALELTARFRLPNKDEIFVSYVRSRARGDLNDFNSYFGDFSQPVVRANQYSNSPTDVPNRLIAWATLHLPRRITISPIFEARTGFPYSVVDAEQNFVGQRNSDRTRSPAFVSLDAEFAKEFQVTKKYGVRLSLRGFNLTDHFNPRDVHANLADPQFGQFFAPYRRFFTGGFDILF